MLRLREIALFQFKNYSDLRLRFDDRIVGICGANGVGKTSLLDAIHYLGFTRSYFGRTDALAVQQGREGFRLEGTMTLQDTPFSLACILRETGKKDFLVNGKGYDKFSEHIGRFPVVVIAPDDSILVTGESKERRAFMDQLIAQVNADYLHALIAYNRVLMQRNAALKEMAMQGRMNESLLDVLDEQLAGHGQYIFQERTRFMELFLPAVLSIYQQIAEDSPALEHESISLVYQSHLQQGDMLGLLRSHRSRDLQVQRTTKGIHRDEIELTLFEQPFKQRASQGQRKSLLFALKLAQHEAIRNFKGFSPLLLLDDVFEKLDEGRILNLLTGVCKQTDAQVFITDTHAPRLARQLNAIQVSHQLINL